ncbi:MAG: DUF1361 domain-containing protein [Sporolactobacillus sp.]
MWNQPEELKRMLVLYGGIYLLFSLGVYILTRQFVHLMMIWNLFLAILPLYFAFLYCQKARQHQTVQARFFGLLWLSFFPNSPYLITDFIHLQGITFIYDVPSPYSAVSYTTGLLSWMSLIQIGIAVLAGIWTGMLSFYLVEQQIQNQWGNRIAFAANLVFCFVSGYAVFVGRFLRLNSWDIMKPLSLLEKLSHSLNRFAVEFSLLFAFFIFILYGLFLLIFGHTSNESGSRLHFHK